MRARHFVDEQKKKAGSGRKKQPPELDLTPDMQVSKTNQPQRPKGPKGPAAYRNQPSVSQPSSINKPKTTTAQGTRQTPNITPDDRPVSSEPARRPGKTGPARPKLPTQIPDTGRVAPRGPVVNPTPEQIKEFQEAAKANKKEWNRQAKAGQQRFLRALTNNPIFNWAGQLIAAADLVSILWHYEMYLSGWEAVNITPRKGEAPMSVNELAPCDTGSWDPFEDPYLDMDYENPDETFDIRQAYVIRGEDFMPTSFGGNPGIPWTSHLFVLYPLVYLTQKGWVTAESWREPNWAEIVTNGDITYTTYTNIGPTESTQRYTISRRLASWVFYVFAGALTTAAVASRVIMQISRAVSVVLVGTGVGLPAAIITALVGGAASWIVASIINGFIKRKERWLRPLSQNIGRYIMSMLATKSNLSRACALRDNFLIKPPFQRDYDDFTPERPDDKVIDMKPELGLTPDQSRPANPIYGDTMNEAADPDAEQPNLGEQEWMAVIDDEFATMWSEMCGEILAELEEKAAGDPKRARQLAIAMQRANTAASREIGNQDEII